MENHNPAAEDRTSSAAAGRKAKGRRKMRRTVSGVMALALALTARASWQMP